MREATLTKANDDPQGTAARLLDAAEEVFAETGFAGASTREIARRAGVPFGALHYHWGSKRELLEAVYARVARRYRDTLDRALPAAAATPGEAVDRAVDAFVDVLVQHRNATRLLHRGGLEPPSQDFRAIMLEFWTHLFGRMRALGIPLPAEPAPMFVMTNAFVGTIVDEFGQRAALDGVIRESPVAREKLLVELRRLARHAFGIREDA